MTPLVFDPKLAFFYCSAEKMGAAPKIAVLFIALCLPGVGEPSFRTRLSEGSLCGGVVRRHLTATDPGACLSYLHSKRTNRCSLANRKNEERSTSRSELEW